jgi:hypothetical protein
VARTSHTVPRSGGLTPTAVFAVLLAVLTALFCSPSADPHALAPPSEALISAAAQTGDAPWADDGHSAACTALPRGPRDCPGERVSPPVTATLASHRVLAGPPRSAFTEPTAGSPPVALLLADRHQGRAPPPQPGT